MNCREIDTLLTQYLEQDLQKNIESLVKKHLNTCPRCRQSLENMKTLKTIFENKQRQFEENQEHREELKEALLRDFRITRTASPFLAGLHRKLEELKKRKKTFPQGINQKSG